MSPYDILGVTPDINENELKSIYRKLILKHHPDKGGNSDEFNKINSAYEEIKTSMGNESKTKSKSFNVMNIVKSFVKTRIPREYHSLYLTLDEMYNGKTIVIHYTQFIPCDMCKTSHCKLCSGTGKILHHMELFGMKQKLHLNCDECEGEGFLRHSCMTCETSGYKEIIKKYKIQIERGTCEGDKISLQNNTLIFIIKEKEHPRFKRHDNDLILFKTISLYDALNCSKVNCKHLNGKTYSFYTKQSISFENIYVLHHLGMPVKGKNSFGNLYIKFNIIIPQIDFESLSTEENTTIKKLFDLNLNSNSNKKCIEKELQLVNDYDINLSLMKHIKLNTQI